MMKKLLYLLVFLGLAGGGWSQQLTHEMIFRVNSPGTIAEDMEYAYCTDWGPTIMSTVTGDLAWGYTAAGDSVGCNNTPLTPAPIVTNLTGKVALIRRGLCNYSLKAYYAQAMGAIGCVIVDYTPASPVGLSNMIGGDSMAAVSIPCVFINYEDGLILSSQVDAGVPTSVSFFVPSVYDGVVSYARQTPVSQMSDLTNMRTTVYNKSTTTVSSVDITLDIYDPLGGVTSYVETLGTLIGYQDSIVTFAGTYSPAAIGNYTTVFKTSLDPLDSIVGGFEITNNLFALDNNDFSNARGSGPSDADFAAADPATGATFFYEQGATYLVPNNVSADSIMATFALKNASTYFGEDFIYLLYEEPAGGFLGTETDYSTFTLMAGALHTVSAADTVPHTLMTERLFNISTGSGFYDLTAGKQYMLVMRYSGSGSILSSPKFSYTHIEDFLGIGSTAYTDQLYMTDWSPGYAPVIRLQIEACQVTTAFLTETICKSYTSPSGDSIWTTSGTYTDVILNMAGCDSLLTINLTVNNPDTSVTITGSSLAAVASGTATYQWVNCADMLPIGGATNQSFTATVNGDYAVIVTDNGCADTSACVSITSIGVEESWLNNIAIYPVPASDQLTISGMSFEGTFTLNLLNSLGQIVVSKTYKGVQQATLDLTGVEAGIYQVQFFTGNKQGVKSIVVLK